MEYVGKCVCCSIKVMPNSSADAKTAWSFQPLQGAAMYFTPLLAA